MAKIIHNQQITDIQHLLKESGIKQVVISPGSRNAPLIQGFFRDKYFILHSIVDERSAGYFALGMAKELNEPVIITTTSGTAALNLAPAIAEAYYQGIALIVITADRPLVWPPQSNNQIIDQQEIFIKNSKAFINVPFDIRDRNKLQKINDRVSDIIRLSNTGKSGPVHINIQLREPLYQQLPSNFSGAISFHKDAPETGEVPRLLPEINFQQIQEAFKGGRKILILAGMSKYTVEEEKLLIVLSEKFQVVVIAENITNLFSDRFIQFPEIVLGSIGDDGRKALLPEIVISFGGQIVSKKISVFLKELVDVPMYTFDKIPLDIIQSLLNSGISDESNNYLGYWKYPELIAFDKAWEFIVSAPFSNLSAVWRILNKIPSNSVLHLGNSGTIRYSQLCRVTTKLHYYSNRGTSGIDGCLSTAVGAASVSMALHIAIVGDLSFVYDSNALWNRNFPANLRVIVLNDKGGGIFRIIDGPDKMPFFEEYSIAFHPVSIENLVKAFGIKYFHAAEYESLEYALDILFDNETGPAVLEVETAGFENSTIFKQFYKNLMN